MKPASYSIGRLANSAAVASLSLMLTLSRTLRDGNAAVDVLDLADKVDQGVFGAAAFGKRQFAPWNLHHDGNKIFGAIQLEVIDLHRDGEFGDGILEHQRVFELPFFIGGGELAEFFAGVVALTVIQLGCRVGVDGDLDAPELAVQRGVGGVVLR